MASVFFKMCMGNFKAKGKYLDYFEFFANNGYSIAPDFKTLFVKNENETVTDHYNKMQDYSRAHLENFGRMYKTALMNHPIFKEGSFNSSENFSSSSSSEKNHSKGEGFSEEKNNLWEIVDFINKVSLGVIQTISLIQQQYMTYLFQEFGNVALRAAEGHASNSEEKDNIEKAKEFSKRTAEYLSSIANISMNAQKEIFGKLRDNKNYNEAEEKMKNMKESGMWSDFDADDFYSSFGQKYNSEKSNLKNEEKEKDEEKNLKNEEIKNNNSENSRKSEEENFSEKEFLNKEKFKETIKKKKCIKKGKEKDVDELFDRSIKKEKDEIDELFK